MLSLGDSFEYTNSIVGFALQITNDAPEFYVFMYLIVIAWIYVVLMMSVAEATNSNGTLLGALVTFVLYGLGPVALVVYLMGAPARSKAIKKRAAEELQQCRCRNPRENCRSPCGRRARATQRLTALRAGACGPLRRNAADTIAASVAPKSGSHVWPAWLALAGSTASATPRATRLSTVCTESTSATSCSDRPRGPAWSSSRRRSAWGALGITSERCTTSARRRRVRQRPAAHQHQGLAHQRLLRDLRRGRGIEQDGDVGAAGHQPFAQPQAQSFHHGDAGLRKLRVEALDEVGRDDVRHARRQADGQAAARVALALRHVGAGAVGQFLDGAGMHQQRRAGFRGHGAAAVPLQQPLADLLLRATAPGG
jgi:hypothetical protein